MQVVNGNLELKRSIHFGRQNYILFDQKTKAYYFYIDGSDILFEINTTGIVTNGDLTVDGIFVTDDIITSSLIVGTSASIPTLTSTEISTTTLNANELNLSGALQGNFDIIANSIEITSDSIFHGDLTIEGGLDVLGSITAASAVDVSVTQPLLHLGVGNPSDLLDIGFYGEYNDGVTQVFTGLFRDASTVNNQWKLFQGVTNNPDPNVSTVDNYAPLRVGNFTVANVVSSGNIIAIGDIFASDIGSVNIGVTGTATINNLINTTGTITNLSSTDGTITTLDTTQIRSTDIGTTILGVTGTATINNLSNITTTSTLIRSNQIGVTNLGVTNDLTVSGDTTLINVDATNITLIGDLNAGDNITANSLNITTDATIEGDLTVNTNTRIVGDLVVDTNTLYVESTDNQVGIGTTNPNYTLDVNGDINLTGVLYQNGVTLDAFLWNLDDVGGTNAYNTNTGNIGIGLTNPSYKLDVVGDINATGVYRLDGTQVLNNTTLGSGVINSSLTNVGTLSSLNVSGNLTVDTNTLHVNATTNKVSIGTLSSSSTIVPLHLHSSGNTQIHFTNTDTGETNSDGTIMGLNGNEDFFFLQREARAVLFSTNNTERMRIDSSGNMGVGKTAGAGNLLDVNGNMNLSTGGNYEINDTSVLNATTLGSGVVNSSLTNVGTLTSLTVSGLVNAQATALISSLGVTNDIVVGGLIDVPLLLSNETGVTTLGVTGTATINDLTSTTGSIVTLDSTLIQSNEIGVTTLGVTGSAIINDLTSTTLDVSNSAQINSLGITDYIDFTVDITAPAHSEGRLFYDGIEHTLGLYNDETEVTHQIGQEGLIRVYNNSGSTILNGKAVYITGNEGTENRPTIGLARADDETTAKVIGIATHDIENNTFGYITYWGLVNDVDTSAFSAGDIIYLSEITAGNFSTTKPTQSNYLVTIGYIITSNVSGRIIVSINESITSTIGESSEITKDVIKGTTGSLSKGDPVYISGFDSINNVTTVELANASNSSTMPALGILREDITNTITGKIILSGLLSSFDTSSYTIGDGLFVSTSGTLTNVKPDYDNLIQRIATVTQVGTTDGRIQIIGAGRTNDLPNLDTGRIWVGTTNEYPIEYQDVFISVTTNQIGIGTDTPSFKLDVSGGINTATALYIEGIDINTVFNIIQVENKKTYFNDFLTLNGSNEITGNYVGVTEFSYTNNSSTQTLFVSNMVISLQDDGPFNLNQYAGTGSVLSNGINVFYTTDSGATKNYIIGTTYNIKSNSDWNNYTNDIKLTDLGTGDAIYTATLDFRKNGAYLILPQNERFGIEVQDDFTLLNSHKARINGFLYANTEL